MEANEIVNLWNNGKKSYRSNFYKKFGIQLDTDIENDVLLKILEKSKILFFANENNFHSYVHNSIRNEYISFLRKQSAESKYLRLKNNELSIQQNLYDINLYQSKINQLRKIDREIFNYLIEGYSVNEIVKKTGLNRSVISYRIFKIRNKFFPNRKKKKFTRNGTKQAQLGE